jgi:hypothetical protein
VTRDQKLAMRRDVGGSVYLLTTNVAAEQLTELSRHFNIRCGVGTVWPGQRLHDTAWLYQLGRASQVLTAGAG